MLIQLIGEYNDVLEVSRAMYAREVTFLPKPLGEEGKDDPLVLELVDVYEVDYAIMTNFEVVKLISGILGDVTYKEVDRKGQPYICIRQDQDEEKKEVPAPTGEEEVEFEGETLHPWYPTMDTMDEIDF